MKVKAMMVVVAFVFALVLYLEHGDKRQSTTYEVPTQQASSEVLATISDKAIIDALQAEAQIVGFSGEANKHVSMSDDKWFGKRNVSMTINGRFKLGFEVGDLSYQIEGNRIVIFTPPVILISLEAPYSEARVVKDIGAMRSDFAEYQIRAMYGVAYDGLREEIMRDKSLIEAAQLRSEDAISVLLRSVPNVGDIEFRRKVFEVNE